ncbi:MAG: hypothetical protein COV66_03290 [Nitrospinae bacterium CG11_big_fil_rev_8_21_14_0_20_45_15]|nr:MAG: hypothetical protein COV66_03290 [Nitrospinae bacterium CG11_big_fil_rev_8_21_14_0_20_45_15]
MANKNQYYLNGGSMFIKSYDDEWTTFVNLNNCTGIIVMEKIDGMPGKWLVRFQTTGGTNYDSTVFGSREDAQKWLNEILKQSGG